MKKYVLFIAFILTATLVIGQNIEASPLLVTDFVEGYLGPDDRVGHATMTNTSSDEKTFNWDINTLCNSADFQLTYCDKGGCYLPGNISGQVILAGGESGAMDLHIKSDGVNNEMVSEITLAEVGNPDNTVTVTFSYAECGTVGTAEIEAAQSITLFPNPAADQFTLSDNEVVESVAVYNILGSVVKQFEASANGTYDVADLNTGIYLVQLRGEDEEVLRTMKMNKL